MSRMTDTIRTAWAWTNLDPVDVLATNAFGNLILQSRDGGIWRICPEELTCTRIADDLTAFRELWQSADFQQNWQMQRLVDIATGQLGPLPDDRCYCLKIPAVLGGQYHPDNLATISRTELISFAGKLAEQIKDIPDGGEIRIKIDP